MRNAHAEIDFWQCFLCAIYLTSNLKITEFRRIVFIIFG